MTETMTACSFDEFVRRNVSCRRVLSRPDPFDDGLKWVVCEFKGTFHAPVDLVATHRACSDDVNPLLIRADAVAVLDGVASDEPPDTIVRLECISPEYHFVALRRNGTFALTCNGDPMFHVILAAMLPTIVFADGARLQYDMHSVAAQSNVYTEGLASICRVVLRATIDVEGVRRREPNAVRSTRPALRDAVILKHRYYSIPVQRLECQKAAVLADGVIYVCCRAPWQSWHTLRVLVGFLMDQGLLTWCTEARPVPPLHEMDPAWFGDDDLDGLSEPMQE